MEVLAIKSQLDKLQAAEKEIEGLKTALAAERERNQWQAQWLACVQPCLAPVATAPIAMKSAPSAARRGSVAWRPFDKTRGSGRALGGLSLSVVIFGATGDLARKKLFPALYQLVLHGYLPRVGLNIIGYGRSPVVLKDFLAKQCVNCAASAALPMPEFLAMISFFAGGYDDPAAFERLDLDLREREGGRAANRLFFLSVPPTIFGTVCKMIKAKACAEDQVRACNTCTASPHVQMRVRRPSLAHGPASTHSTSMAHVRMSRRPCEWPVPALCT